MLLDRWTGDLRLLRPVKHSCQDGGRVIMNGSIFRAGECWERV